MGGRAPAGVSGVRGENKPEKYVVGCRVHAGAARTEVAPYFQGLRAPRDPEKEYLLYFMYGFRQQTNKECDQQARKPLGPIQKEII